MSRTIFPKSIRSKIILSTAAVTLSIATITVSICYMVFQSFLRKAEIQSAEFNLQVISNNVAVDMENIFNFNQWCCSSPDISRYLESFRNQPKMPSISSKDYVLRSVALSAYDRLKEEYGSTHSSDYINRIIVSPANRRNYLQISDTYAINTSSSADELYKHDFFRQLLDAPDYYWDGLKKDPLLSSPDKLFLPVARPIYSQYSSEKIGWVFLTVSDRLISDYIGAFPLEADSSIYITIGSHSYLFQDGAFLETDFSFETLSDISSKTFNRDNRAFHAKLPDGTKRAIVTCPLGTQGWTISQVLSEQAYTTQGQAYRLIIGGIVLFIILTGILLYVMLNRIINHPVKMLQGKIGRIANGDFSRDASIEWQDEFGSIGRGINRMSENVVTLMNKKVDDEKQKKDLEYQILQSQINPHFLYNTLNSIKWMATIQGATGIVEMTTALARLMKNVSKGSAARISLKEELDLVNDYFLIQQYRYGGSITLECRIDDDRLYDCLVHRFTLQPIVENALFHGIEPKGCAGKIQIKAEFASASDGKRAVRIFVTDNGIGMSRETIDKVLRGDASGNADFFRQVGINNVNKRIQYDYGEHYGITIESEPGQYTTIMITLPFVTAQGDEKND